LLRDDALLDEQLCQRVRLVKARNDQVFQCNGNVLIGLIHRVHFSDKTNFSIFVRIVAA